ncbi:SDR family oxidoreductase [Porphyrobacter sp. TH134]|uniref:SDR family oxidoreductase n=1 Tax=Porphyrobacter sp. TH134 TaxID=2067450 RepID=UPI00117CF648|nr:NAD(P)H-binding protein [Porphyrobacter sp. TH134]
MHDRILITGGTGKTGQLVASQLALRGVEVRIAARNPLSPDQLRFEWNDPATHIDALEGVGAVYLVAPTDQTEHLSVMRPFLERAVSQVPGRLVLLSASSLEEGGPMMGEVHAWLSAHAPLWTVNGGVKVGHWAAQNQAT